MSKTSRKKTTIPVAETMEATLEELPSAEIPSQNSSMATTGRFIVIYKEEASKDVGRIQTFLKNAGLKNMMTTSDFSSASLASAQLSSAQGMTYEKLGIGIINNADDIMALSASLSSDANPIMNIEPEYIAYPSNMANISMDYLSGYRDAINQLYKNIGAGTEMNEFYNASVLSNIQDNEQYSWGIQAIGAHTSKYSGQGIKIVILDTGFDTAHPDFSGRVISAESFSGAPVMDINGHGTHCIGIASGPQLPFSGVRRYGVAYNAQIYVGKVFNNDVLPKTPTENVLSGIEWALENECDIASLSLGVRINQRLDQYEVPILRALKAGLLIVAAAGNNASRPHNPGFVEPPANTEGAMAVGALNNDLSIASFSSRSSPVTGNGGIVNIAAPGTKIFSSFPVSLGSHAFLDGTSMATPFVAGVAALYAEATGDRGQALWARLIQNSHPLNISSQDVGSGMVKAPQ